MTALDGIRAKLGSNTTVVYEKAINFTNDTVLAYNSNNGQYSWEGGNDFIAAYFGNRELKGTPVLIRREAVVDHFWQEGQRVSDSLKAIDFSARYTTTYIATQTGETTFEVDADDGYRLYIDGKLLLDAWNRNRWGARTYSLPTEKGRSYQLILEYYQGDGKASVRLRTGHLVQTDMNALVKKYKDADAFIFVGGISPQLEGEEMKVNYPGFDGGDRTSIMLPAVQTRLLQALQASGKPVVFVMMTGSALAVPWEAAHIPAIVNAWYGGQSAGTALADVIFGDYNPAGRLPVSFYASDNDLPSFTDYSMKNRTYRYFTGKPLYGFGYGLSYTSFRYDALQLPAPGNTGILRVRVTNTGMRDGDEVAELYISSTNNSQPAPIRSLRGFQRFFLKAGESRVLQFRITDEDLSVWNDQGIPQRFTGRVLVSVGGSQPDAQTEAAKKTVTAVLHL